MHNSIPASKGAAAGAFSAFVFTIIHDIFISDIWFSAVIMMLAGAVCGLLIAWSYTLIVETPSIKSWLGYNTLYLGLFGLLGAISVAVFDPITTISALVAANAPPDDLIAQAAPLTALFTIISAVFISLVYRKGWASFGAIALTCVVLVLLLGLNVSVIGLVAIPRGALYLILELFGLIIALNAIYAVGVILLARQVFSAQ